MPEHMRTFVTCAGTALTCTVFQHLLQFPARRSCSVRVECMTGRGLAPRGLKGLTSLSVFVCGVRIYMPKLLSLVAGS